MCVFLKLSLDDECAFLPQISSSPALGFSKLPKMCSSVLLPSPDFPIMATAEPLSTSSDMSCNSCTETGEKKCFLMWLARKITSFILTSGFQRGEGGRL